ncbi:MAG: hypothetical protein M1820_002718 [Bogoriella megaspora]|nr:MAG: hypothetical protein M1820_002718 [Bogoriella megaspora]
MASKFFTWTKGERRNAAENLRIGGLIPASENILDENANVESPVRNGITKMLQKSPKIGRRPKPLALAPLQDPNSSTLNPSSLALQDAAVNSATHLLAVVNDILRSPPLSGGAPRSPLSQTFQNGRPRSHTAPPTPVAEINLIAELPGSLLQENQGFPKTHFASGRIALGLEKTPPGVLLGFDRPKTSPPESALSFRHRRSVSETNAQSTVPAMRYRNENKSQKLERDCPPLPMTSRIVNEGATVQPNSSSLDTTCPTGPDMIPEKNAAEKPLPPVALDVESDDLLPVLADRDRTIALLTAQLANLRRSHDAYVTSLNGAHEKEMNALRLYANCLEEQRGLNSEESPEVLDKGKLRVNTSLQPISLHKQVAEGSSATSMQSFQSAFEDQRRVSQEMAAEMETLKRKLSAAKKRDSEADAIRKENYLLKESLKVKQQHLETLMKKLAKTKMTEKAMINTADALGSRLEVANMQNNDVLEENHELRQTALRLHKRDRDLKQDFEHFRQESNETMIHVRARLRNAEEHADCLEQTLQSYQTSENYVQSSTDDLQKYIYQLEQEAEERKQHVSRLEKKLGMSLNIPPSTSSPRQHYVAYVPGVKLASFQSASDTRTSQTETSYNDYSVDGVGEKLQSQDERTKALQAERDSLITLLQSGIRKQARNSPDQQHPATSPLSARLNIEQAFADVQARAQNSLADNGIPSEPASDPTQRAEQLQQEITYHINDILLYKLDVRGYKKDLKRANAKIRQLQELSARPSPSPGLGGSHHRTSSSTTSLPVLVSSQATAQQDWSLSLPESTGLGISSPDIDLHHPQRGDTLPPPPLPPKKGDSSSAAALAPPSCKINIWSLPSPSISPRPTTPVSTDRRLPRTPITPPSTNSPGPAKASKGKSTMYQVAKKPVDVTSHPALPSPAPSAISTISSLPPSEVKASQRMDRSLSESVVEALSGSPPVKESVLSHSNGTSSGNGSILMGGKKFTMKPTGRRTKSANTAIPVTTKLDGGIIRVEAKNEETPDSGVEMR